MQSALSRFAAAILNMIVTGICPFGTTWLCHVIVALCIMGLGFVISLFALPPVYAALVGAVAAAGFYLVREIRNVRSSKARYRAMEGLTRFDWPGLVAPVVAVTLLFLILAGIAALVD